MALQDLLSAIRAEADAETARVESESRLETGRILTAAEREAGELEGARLRRARGELDTELARRRALARLAAARVLARGREQVFDELVDELRRRLGDLRGSDGYRKLFAQLLHESVAALPTARQLRVDPRDEALARELAADLGGGLEVRPELCTAGGVELQTADGRRLRNTFEARLEAAEPELRMSCGRLLAELARNRVSPPRNDEAV